MKNIEAIKLILKEQPNEDIYNLFTNDKYHNLIYLCILNKKYLNDDVLNQILNSKESFLNISYLLYNFPETINKIPNILLEKLNKHNWTFILKHQPQLFDYCKISFDIPNWDIIVRSNPQLINKYKEIYKNENTLLYFILNSKEDLKFDFNEISKFDIHNNITRFNLYNWLEILETNPDLIKICPKINESDSWYDKHPYEVISLVSKQIQFKYLLPHINMIGNNELAILIANQPQLIEELKIDFKTFDECDWGNILSKQPQLIDKCDKLDDIKTYSLTFYKTWIEILKSQPQLIKYCNKIDNINTNNWSNILQYQPILANYCNKFDKFDEYNWYGLLKKQPQLIDKCNDVNIIRRKYRIELLKMHPNLLDKIPIKSINKDCIEIIYNSKEHHLKYMKSYIRKNKDKKVLTDMINLYSDLKDLYTKKNLWKYVDFNQLTENLEYSMLK